MPTVREILYGRRGFRVRAEHEPVLAAVHDAARAAETAREALAAAIRSARDADVPFRAIAAAAELSHEQIRRIVAAAPDR